MNLLTTSTLASAQDYNARAQAYVERHDRKARMGQWSDIYTDGTLFGISWEDRIAGAFTPSELGAVPTKDNTTTNTNVREVADWVMYVPPALDAPLT